MNLLSITKSKYHLFSSIQQNIDIYDDDPFNTPLTSPTSAHERGFRQLMPSILEDVTSCSLLHTILRGCAASLFITLALQIWLLATYIFPSIKEKYNEWIIKYPLLDRFACYYTFVNKKILRNTRLFILSVSAFFNMCVCVLLTALDYIII